MLCTQCNAREALQPERVSHLAEHLDVKLPTGLCSHCLSNDPQVRQELAGKGRQKVGEAILSVRQVIARALEAIDEWAAPPK